MTKGDGKPCKRCGTSEWYKGGECKRCHNAKTQQWKKDNPEKHRESRRGWKKRNPEKMQGYIRKWQKNNPEKNRESVSASQKKHPEKHLATNHRYRTRKTEAGGSYTAAEWKALKKQYGGRCLCCGKKKKLTADHVIPVIAGGTSDISNIQPLCRGCNSSKGTKTTDYRTKSGILRWIQERLL